MESLPQITDMNLPAAGLQNVRNHAATGWKRHFQSFGLLSESDDIPLSDFIRSSNLRHCFVVRHCLVSARHTGISQSNPKKSRKKIRRIKLVLSRRRFFFLTLPTKLIAYGKSNTQINHLSDDSDAVLGIRTYRHH